MAQQNVISILIQAQDKATSTLSGVVDQFQSNMKKVTLAAGAAGVTLTAFEKSSIDYLKGVTASSKELSRETGMSIEQSSGLVAAFEHVGLSSDTASTAFKRFSKNISESRTNAADNASKVADMTNKIQAARIQITKYNDEIAKNGDTSGELHNRIDALNIQIQGYQKNIDSTANTLDKLGVSTVDATGKNKDFETILLQVADKFAAMPDGAEKTANALDLFGRSGADMIKILDKGSSGIKDLEDQAKKLGLTLTSQNIGAINDYIASQKKLSETTQAVKIQVGTLTAPIMTHFNEVLNDTITKLIGADSPTRTLVADILAFGGPVLNATAGLASFGSNLAGALPLIEKFGLKTGAKAGGAALATGELTEAVAGGGGLLASLGPLGLAVGVTALAAGGAYLAFRHFKQAADQANSSMTDGTGVNARYGGAVDLVKLATDRLHDAQAAVKDSTEKLATDHDALKQAHQRVADTLNTLGTPAQDAYYRALANEAEQNVTVLSQEGDLYGKRHELADATSFLKQLNDGLNDSLHGTAGKVADLGPAAQSVVGSLQVVQDKIHGINISWNSTNGQIQSQITQVNGILFGTQSTINQVQNSFGKLQATAGGIKINGGGVTIQGGGMHALGTNFAEDSFVAGEHGPELIVGQRGSKVYNNRQTEKMLGGGGNTVHIGNLNVSNDMDLRRIVREIGWRLQVAL